MRPSDLSSSLFLHRAVSSIVIGRIIDHLHSNSDIGVERGIYYSTRFAVRIGISEQGARLL